MCVKALTVWSTLVWTCVATAQTASVPSLDQLGNKRETVDPLVTMPVEYTKAMVVVVAKQGVAALHFEDSFELANETGNGVSGVKYRWRYLARGQAAEQTGEGRVFAKYRDGRINHGQTEIVAGEIKVDWAGDGKKVGLIRFPAEKMSVHPVARHYFEAGKVRNGQPPQPALSLAPFLVPLGSWQPGKKRTTYRHCAAPVHYDGMVLVIRSGAGLATIRFGEAFTREVDEENTHYGNSYQFRFWPIDGGQFEEGEGEVYERYRNGRYSQGQLDIEAGDIKVNWSRGGQWMGWIYFDTNQILVWNVLSEDEPKLLAALQSAVQDSAP